MDDAENVMKMECRCGVSYFYGFIGKDVFPMTFENLLNFFSGKKEESM